jgi:hypothetical protein
MIPRFAQIVLVPALFAAAGACAQSTDPGQLPETVSRIERETGGRVLSAQKSQRGGREVNRIKVLTPEGRVRVMWDDPQRDRTQRDRMEIPRRSERVTRFPADARRAGPERESGTAERDER